MNIDETSDNASLPKQYFNEHNPYITDYFVSNLNEVINPTNEINIQNNVGFVKDILPNNVQINSYVDNSAQINDENYNIENVIKATNKDEKTNSEILKDNKIVDLLQNKSTTCHIDEINGKKIITSNNMCDNAFDDIFGTKEMNIPTLKEMQMLKKKRKRRTREEIENDKKNENTSEQKVLKKRGRKKQDIFENDEEKTKHSKHSDDNITKKINSNYIEEIKTWLNKSFLDSTNMDFQDEKLKKKFNDNYFLKIDTNLISNQIKRKSMIETMGKTFKEIFYFTPISSKYTKLPKSNNKDLIEKIYQENNQPFVMFILEMTFLEGLNYFNGQIPDSIIFNYFKEKYSVELIQKFINNFGKIDAFFAKLYKKYNGENNINEIKDYLSKIKVLALNYKESFENKYDRRENKKNNNNNEEKQN
jgi:hypothetical protein